MAKVLIEYDFNPFEFIEAFFMSQHLVYPGEHFTEPEKKCILVLLKGAFHMSVRSGWVLLLVKSYASLSIICLINLTIFERGIFKSSTFVIELPIFSVVASYIFSSVVRWTYAYCYIFLMDSSFFL